MHECSIDIHALCYLSSRTAINGDSLHVRQVSDSDDVATRNAVKSHRIDHEGLADKQRAQRREDFRLQALCGLLGRQSPRFKIGNNGREERDAGVQRGGELCAQGVFEVGSVSHSSVSRPTAGNVDDRLRDLDEFVRRG
jgi:hypothetical protein